MTAREAIRQIIAEKFQKVSKESVNYRLGTKAKHCGNCSMFSDNRCTLVAGVIESDHVCDKWEER